MSGLDVAKEVLRRQPEVRIVMFTIHDSNVVKQVVKRVGVQGLVSKSNASRDLLRALGIVAGGGTFFE
jgi:DNA-binding NarL/FixJ family response regulator